MPPETFHWEIFGDKSRKKGKKVKKVKNGKCRGKMEKGRRKMRKKCKRKGGKSEI